MLELPFPQEAHLQNSRGRRPSRANQPGVGFRVSGSGFLVSGFWFLVSGFWFRAEVSEIDKLKHLPLHCSRSFIFRTPGPVVTTSELHQVQMLTEGIDWSSTR
jgi:hypothetical protein